MKKNQIADDQKPGLENNIETIFNAKKAYENLSPRDYQLIAIRDELYSGSWNRMRKEINARKKRKSNIYINRKDFASDLKRIDKLNRREKEYNVPYQDKELGIRFSKSSLDGQFETLINKYCQQLPERERRILRERIDKPWGAVLANYKNRLNEIAKHEDGAPEGYRIKEELEQAIEAIKKLSAFEEKYNCGNLAKYLVKLPES